MSDDVARDLNAIEEGLRQIGRGPTVNALLPGLSAEVVRAQLEAAGFKSNPTVEAWFGWHDGTSEMNIGASQIFIGFFPLSLEEALSYSKTYRELAGWNSSWLPLLADGGGYFYVEDQASEGPGSVRCYRFDEEIHPIEYLSFESLVASIAEGYRQGAFSAHPSGYLDLDVPLYERIAARLNPGVAWWD